jgi:ubiquinone/menaquinone biosynthesis C-methylase UbiE
VSTELPRSAEQVREHYEIEKVLAARLRDGTASERKQLYNTLYDELCRRVPHHPHLTRRVSPAETQRLVSYQLNFLARFLSKDTTYLEVGPGDCSLALEVARHVRRSIGVDVCSEIAAENRARDNFALMLSDGTSIPVPPASVDIAYSNQLMEHLHPDDARAQLINLNRALKLGGMYVCVTPNRLTGPHDISRDFDLVATGFHLREYTNAELIELFHSCGFHPVRIYSSVRGHPFRVPTQAVLAVERWLLRQSPARARALLSWPSLRKLIDNCRLVAVKSAAAAPL